MTTATKASLTMNSPIFAARRRSTGVSVSVMVYLIQIVLPRAVPCAQSHNAAAARRRLALRRRLLAPKRLRRDPRAFGERFQLRPHDGRVDAARERALRETAIGAAHDVLAADDFGEPHDPLGDQLGMLDEIGGVADHDRDQHFACRQLYEL